MSSKEYIDIHNNFNEAQEEAMFDLYMKGINHDGHVWVTFGDVEETVVKLFKYCDSCMEHYYTHSNPEDSYRESYEKIEI